MALAPFFDKAALAAAAVLQGFDRERFTATLDAQVVAVAFDGAAVVSFEGRTNLTLAVNLAARLYPALTLVAHGAEATAFWSDLAGVARAVNPNVAISARMTESAAESGHVASRESSRAPSDEGLGQQCVDAGTEMSPVLLEAPQAGPVALIVGDTHADVFGFASTVTAIYAGSTAWEARLSTANPVGCGASALPFGAAAAACIGIANVFRHVFRTQLSNGDLDDALTISTLSLRTRTGVDPATAPSLDPSVNTVLVEVDLGEAVLIGAGAVGQGALWTLVRVVHLRGTLHAVDGEVLDASNPQRYVLASSSDVGTSKVALAAALFSGADDGVAPSDPSRSGAVLRAVAPAEGASLTLVPNRARWGEFLATRPRPWRLQRVLVALDSARDRIAVQAALPRWIANAWTQPGDLGLSRHEGLGTTACLACLYLPTGAGAAHEDALVAEAVGLSSHLMMVRHLLVTNAPVDDAVIAQMAAGLGVPVEPLLAFRGRPLRAFYTEAICGGVVLRLQSQEQDAATEAGVGAHGGQPRDRAAMVPMAFQSVLAGVLLAAAAVAEAASLETPVLGQKAVINLLRPIGGRLLVPVGRHGSGKCLCQDRDYQSAFHDQWSASDPDSLPSEPQPGLRTAGHGNVVSEE